MGENIIIKNGIIITMEDDTPIIENGSLFIKNGLIESIGNFETESGDSFDLIEAKIIDASGCIVMPGLVNCHTHLPMSLFRGLADDLPLLTWLNDYIFPAEARKINSESVKKWALLSCRELLFSGTTTCCDGYFYETEVAETVEQSGLRAVLGQAVIDFPSPDVPDPLKSIDNAIEFIETVSGRCSRIQPSIFCHSPYTCSAETLKKAKQSADSRGVIFQIHVSETKNERNMIKENNGLSPVHYLDSIGVLDSNTLLVHCVWVDLDDIEIIKKTGASIVYCPESNMKLASGIAPVSEFIKFAISMGIGTDGCASNNNLDLFIEMDTGAKLQKAATGDPCVMNAKQMLKMGTMGGACALGLGDSIGSLKKGKKADIIIIDIDKPHLVPMYDPYSALVYSATGADVRDVIIDGRIIVSKGKLNHELNGLPANLYQNG